MPVRRALALGTLLLSVGCCDPSAIGHASCETRRSLDEFERTGSTERFVEHWHAVDAAPGTATCIVTLEWALDRPAALEPFLAALPDVEREWFTCVVSAAAGDAGLDRRLLAAFETDPGEHVRRLLDLVRLVRDGEAEALSAACEAACGRREVALGRAS
jgi:hypothetical protein